mgnify:CR=1 FL=1
MNLIEQLGGYEAAKGLFNLYEYSISFRYYKDFEGDFESAGYVDVFIPDLQKALLEHRRQHNIFEPDDYIIHDGELKVFAMWSSAVEGCAYIGYAYAENGEMAHKDEFRHATDEEIKAGKRLEVS